MEVSFDVEKKHLIDFSIYNVKNSKQIKRAVNIQRFVTPLMFLLFALLIGIYQGEIVKWMLIFVGMYIAWVIVYPKMYMMSVKNSIKKGIEEVNGKKDLIGNCKLTLTDDGVLEQSNVRTNTTQWKDITKLVETEEYVFVFNTENSAYVIPKESFVNSEDKKQYTNILSDKSGSQLEQWV